MIGGEIYIFLSFKDPLINKKKRMHWLFGLGNAKFAHAKLLIKHLKC
jgi:hypothetical protein